MPDERVERVDVVGQPDGERHRVVVGGLRRRGRRSRARGERRDQQRRGRRRPGEREYGAGLCPTPTGPPSRAPHEPHEHVAHGVRATRSVPLDAPPSRRAPPELLAHLAAEREWYDVATGHLGPLVHGAALRDDGPGPELLTRRSVGRAWLFLLHGHAGRKGVPVIWREVVRFRARRGSLPRPRTTISPARTRGAARRQRARAGDAATSTSGCSVVSPDERAAGLLGRHRAATRSTSCASATWRPARTWTTSCRGASLRRRLDGGLVVLLLHRATTSRGGRTRSGGTGSGRPRPPTSWCWRSRTTSSSSRCRRPARRPGRHLVARAATPARCGCVDAADADLGRPARWAAGGRGVEYHAEHVRDADGSTSCSLVTNDDAPEFRLASLPGARARRPGLIRVGAGATRGPGRAARAGRRVRRPRRARRSRRRPQPLLRVLPLDDLAGEGSSSAAASRSRDPVWRRNDRRVRRRPRSPWSTSPT